MFLMRSTFEIQDNCYSIGHIVREDLNTMGLWHLETIET